MYSLTPNHLSRKLGFLLCLIALTLTGCHQSADQTPVASDDPCAEFSNAYGTLKHLKRTTHPDLQKEYALLVEKEHTPCRLYQKDEDPDRNAAAALKKALTKDQAEEITQSTKFLFQRERFAFNPIQLKKIKSLADENDYKTLLVTEAMELPNCNFEYRYPDGLMADDSFVDRVLAAARLQEVATANLLFNTKQTPTEGNQIDPSLKKALDRIQAIFKLADRLGQAKQVRARLTAESIREEVSFILESLVHDPRCNKAALLRLQKIVDEELTHWTRDAEMWIGDRALGLYVYEAVRDGMILSILTEEEKDAFRQEGTLPYLAETTQETADEDELYYLETMRNLIDQCDRDFYRRPLLGSKIIQDLESRKNSPNYPLVAAKVLLGEVDSALMIQVADLARIRAWSVALDVALGKTPRDNINPINGEPYLITQTDKAVTVRAVPEENADELNSPLDTEAKQFLANKLQQPVVIPTSVARE